MHNTIFNRRSGGFYVVNKGATPALLVNNLFSGSTGPGVKGDYEGEGNLTLPVSSFVNVRGDDFRLTARSPAIDSSVAARVPAPQVKGPPAYQPLVPLAATPRPASPLPDVGAFEYCAPCKTSEIASQRASCGRCSTSSSNAGWG